MEFFIARWGGDPYSEKQILSAVRWRPNALIPVGGFSALRMVFGANPADLYGWEDKDEDLTFAQDTSLSGRFVQQWALRIMAQEAALREIADSRLRKLLAYYRPADCADFKIGDAASVCFNKMGKVGAFPLFYGASGFFFV